MSDRPLPAILGWELEPADPTQSCNCLCGVRHPEEMGVCQGVLATLGFRIHFNSLYDTDGVPVCHPCGEAMPENRFTHP